MIDVDGKVPHVTCTGVSKSYGRRMALSDVSAEFSRGVTAVLGPNGAGKTTLLSILATVIRPSAGRVTVSGVEVCANSLDAVRRLIGYLPQRFDLIGGATVLDNVRYAVFAHGAAANEAIDLAQAALESVGLTDRRSERARKLSGGQRQRLGIACAVVHRPQLLILDEPSVGLDPMARAELRALIAELSQSAAVIMSTHLVDEAAELGDELLVLRSGSVIFNGSATELIDGQVAEADTRALERALTELFS